MAAAAAEPSAPSYSDSPRPPPPLLRRRARRLVFDRRYGWIFDEWIDPAEEALSGGRGMFCVVPMAQSLVNAVASSINFASSSVTHMVSLPLHRKNKAWFRELEHSGVVADLKLNPCRTHCTLDCR